MAPLIDVVFQLLIFFMLTASFSNPAMRLNLPKAVTTDKALNEKITISIDRSGQMAINDKPVRREQLRARLQPLLSSAVSKGVFIKGDQNMPYKYFVEIMDEARQAGATQVNIVHEGVK